MNNMLKKIGASWKSWRIHCFKEDSYLDHQRQLIYAIYVVTLSMGILSNILGISGAFDPFFTATNCVFLFMILGVAVTYVARKIAIIRAIAFSAIITHTFILS